MFLMGVAFFHALSKSRSEFVAASSLRRACGRSHALLTVLGLSVRRPCRGVEVLIRRLSLDLRRCPIRRLAEVMACFRLRGLPLRCAFELSRIRSQHFRSLLLKRYSTFLRKEKP